MAKRSRSTYETSRAFNPDWEIDFFVRKGIDNEVICYICEQKIKGFKKSNFSRHHCTAHSDFEKVYPVFQFFFPFMIKRNDSSKDKHTIPVVIICLQHVLV